MEPNSLDKYIKESCKSFRDASVKNSARRNSLLKKTIIIDRERKLVSAQMAREEKQLREHLKAMQLEMKSNLTSQPKIPEEKEEGEMSPRYKLSVDPYPVTLSCRASTPTKRKTKANWRIGRRHRRKSLEFEDLHMNTETGKLAIPELPVVMFPSPSLSQRLVSGSRSSLSSNEELSLWERKTRKEERNVQNP